MIKRTEKYNQSILKLAGIISQRNKPVWLGAITGEVVNPPPNLQVKIQNNLIIKSHKIMIAIEKINGYFREYSLEGDITEYNLKNTTSTEIASNHAHAIKSLVGKGIYKARGKITWTDTLKKGDLVLMLPTNKSEYFYLIDRVVRL